MWFVLQISKSPKKIFQKTILSLKFKFQVQDSFFGNLKNKSHFLKKSNLFLWSWLLRNYIPWTLAKLGLDTMFKNFTYWPISEKNQNFHWWTLVGPNSGSSYWEGSTWLNSRIKDLCGSILVTIICQMLYFLVKFIYS